jgi:hypothetical protein
MFKTQFISPARFHIMVALRALGCKWLGAQTPVCSPQPRALHVFAHSQFLIGGDGGKLAVTFLLLNMAFPNALRMNHVLENTEPDGQANYVVWNLKRQVIVPVNRVGFTKGSCSKRPFLITVRISSICAKVGS